MICVDCVHALKREYLKEDEECFCFLDGASCGQRLMKCNRYKREVREVVVEIPVVEVEAKKPEVVMLPAKKKGRPLGWRKGY